jgi:hypothetical protein
MVCKREDRSPSPAAEEKATVAKVDDSQDGQPLLDIESQLKIEEDDQSLLNMEEQLKIEDEQRLLNIERPLKIEDESEDKKTTLEPMNAV